MGQLHIGLGELAVLTAQFIDHFERAPAIPSENPGTNGSHDAGGGRDEGQDDFEHAGLSGAQPRFLNKLGGFLA